MHLAPIVALALVLAGSPSGAAVHRVTRDLDHIQVQDVMDRAVYGDTVMVAPGEYMMLTVRNGIRLIGEAAPESAVFRWGNEVLKVNEADSTTLIQGITVDGIKASEGVITAEKSQVRVRNCIIRNGWVGVRGLDSDFVVEDCLVEKCQNGFYLFESRGEIRNCRVEACINGIALYSSSPRIVNNTITRNSLGILVAEHSEPKIGGTLETANRVFNNPGGALKNDALEKKAGIRRENPVSIAVPMNYWGSDCPEPTLFRGNEVRYKPWVDESGKRALEACAAKAK
jgi:parallel beta-helix repeat protein